MRHRVSTRRLGKKPHQAKMIQRNLLTSVLLYENVRTTKKRAQVVQPMVDRIIAIAKGGRKDLAIRRINQFVTDRNACRKAIEVYALRYADRPSGFTRMIPAGMRGGDGALLVDLSFVEGREVAPAKSGIDKISKKNEKREKNKKTIEKSSASASSQSSK